jgi:hydrogenase maturation protease
VSDREIDRLAAAVMYEGYLLYPYRLSVKNVRRWTYGTVPPRVHAEGAGEPEKCRMQSEVLMQGDDGATVGADIRFLQVQQRTVGRRGEKTPGEEFPRVGSLDVSGILHVPWQEGFEREVKLGPIRAKRLMDRPERREFRWPAERRREFLWNASGEVVGDVLRESNAVRGRVEMSAELIRDGLFRIALKIFNESGMASPNDPREAERGSLMATHSILTAQGGRFLSLTDPPPSEADAARDCLNEGTWPVLVGDPASADAMLCSPILLPDYPRLAEESPRDLFDGTENDEILSLRERTGSLARKQMKSLRGAGRLSPEARRAR